jgi:hypothetical protein
MAFADLSSPSVQQTIEEHHAFPNVRGIRQCLNYHRDPVKTFTDQPHAMSDAQWRSGYALLKRYGLSFDLQLYYTQMGEALALAKEVFRYGDSAQLHRGCLSTAQHHTVRSGCNRCVRNATLYVREQLPGRQALQQLRRRFQCVQGDHALLLAR